ncbi:MAG: metallophosphoesterase [Firmicutes bacterium]|nr:metallophosphoesterase [Bacillota bacterium]
MTATDNLKNILSRAVGRLHIPEELSQSKEKKILHISDTPTSLYPAIKNLLKTLEPDILIHTGDLADDIKLEDAPHNLEQYNQVVGPFIEMLEQSNCREIYIIPGNHDNVEVIKGYQNTSALLNEGDIINVDNFKLGLSHSIRNLPGDTQFNLYGHNFKRTKDTNSKTVYLNGIRNIHVILLPSNEVVKIQYPWATNHDRKVNDKHKLPNTI